jgi:hypothetical protein
MNRYLNKFNDSIKNTLFLKLPASEQEFIKNKSRDLKFSHQEIKQIIDMARDLSIWNEKSLVEIFPDHDQKKVVFTRLRIKISETNQTLMKTLNLRTYQKNKSSLLRQKLKKALVLDFVRLHLRRQGVAIF